MTLVGGTVRDYQVVGKLGGGRYSTVYLAHKNGNPLEPVAIKVLEVAGDDDAIHRRRFVREGRVAAGLSHPQLVRVRAWLDVTECNGAIEGPGAIVMDYVGGPTLADALRAGSRSTEQAVAIVSKLADGLDCLHGADIIHRDIKPTNIGSGHPAIDAFDPVILDYGSAKKLRPISDVITLPGSGLAPLTLAYASPEQCEELEAVAASDVYSLAVITCELMTGSLPYPNAANLFQFANIRYTGQLVSLAALRPDLDWPAGLQQVIDRGLERNPSSRFQAAGDFARALRGVLGFDDKMQRIG